jgi:hypothetical protein
VKVGEFAIAHRLPLVARLQRPKHVHRGAYSSFRCRAFAFVPFTVVPFAHCLARRCPRSATSLASFLKTALFGGAPPGGVFTIPRRTRFRTSTLCDLECASVPRLTAMAMVATGPNRSIADTRSSRVSSPNRVVRKTPMLLAHSGRSSRRKKWQCGRLGGVNRRPMSYRAGVIALLAIAMLIAVQRLGGFWHFVHDHLGEHSSFARC